jgi:HSP20 family molecular chaperone IbpA
MEQARPLVARTPRFLDKEGSAFPIRHDWPEPASLAAGPYPASEALLGRFVVDDDYFSPVWAGLPVALWEDHDHVYIEADLPGVDAEEVEVSVEDSKVFIRGARKPEVSRSYLYDGRSYGRFERAITLPEPVDGGRVEVGLNRGVLSIALHKSPKAGFAGDHRGVRRADALTPA